jgi:hypothetical protein
MKIGYSLFLLRFFRDHGIGHWNIPKADEKIKRNPPLLKEERGGI